MDHTFHISDVISLGRSRTKKYFWTILLLGFLAFLPSLIASLFSGGLELAWIAITDPETEVTSYTSSLWGAIDTIITIIGTLLYYRLLIGFTKCTIMIVQDIKPITKDLVVSWMTFVRRVFAQIISGLLAGAGAIFLIIPWIYILIRLSMVQYLLADWYKWDVIKKSRQMTKWNVRKLIGLGLTTLGINILWFLALIFGLLRAMPVVAIAYAAVYLELKKNLPPEIQPIADIKKASSIEAQMMHA